MKIVVIISAFTLILSITYSNSFAVPPERVEACKPDPHGELTIGTEYTCCWTETDADDPEQIEIYKCQHCRLTNSVIDCGPSFPNPNAPPTTKEDISPGDTGVIEQPPKTNDPPIKSGDSVFPKNDGNFLDEQEPNPNSPLTDQRVPHDNLGVLEQSEQGTNFAKKGNSQNSPVPPECPKQGPIPPDCTMKPKF